jgi:hypothetical protein
MTLVFNLGYAMAIRGYLLLVLVGLMIYVTGLSDTLSKVLVVTGVILYLAGPVLINYVASLAGVETLSTESALLVWLNTFGMTDGELIDVLVTIGGFVDSTCALAGAIMYFTPSSGDLKSRGQSLVVRALLFAPVLVFFYVSPWI